MVVRQKVGRKRYIAFDVVDCDGDPTRSKVGRILGKRTAELEGRFPFEVIFVSGRRGVVRTDQKHQAALVALLCSLSMEQDGLKLTTLCASGTIRTLKEEYFPRAPT